MSQPLSRRRRGTPLALAALAAMALLAPAARAASYSYFYTTTQTSFSMAAGQPLTINVYLREDANGADPTASLINSDSGLYTGAFTVTKGAGASTITGVAGNPGTPPAGFDATPIVIGHPSTNVYTVSEQCDLASPAPDGVTSKVVVGAGFNGVFLGKVFIAVAGALNSTTTFTLAPADGSATNDSLYDLDDNTGSTALYDSAASTTFTVRALAAVPEPATAGLVAASAIAFAARRRRRGCGCG